MEGLIPREELEARLRPFYPKAGRGRRPCELSAMLRIHCVQLFYNLSDPGMEDLLQEVESVKRLVGLRLTEALPDETTILNFRHRLEKHELGEGLFEEINRHLKLQGLRLQEGTIVDASLIEAPSSRKNQAGKRGGAMGEAEDLDPGQGGASVPVCEAALWLCEGPLSGAGQEQAAAGVAAGTGQLDDRRALPGGVTGESCAPIRVERDDRSPQRRFEARIASVQAATARQTHPEEDGTSPKIPYHHFNPT